MKTRIVKLDEIKVAKYNPRKQLQESDEVFQILEKSLHKFGLVNPLVINEATNTLISGHQRLNVLKKQGVKEAEAVIVNLTPQKEKLLNLALNKIEGEWDYDKLGELIGEFTDDELSYTGFNPKELDNLFEVDTDNGADIDFTPPETETPVATGTEYAKDYYDNGGDRAGGTETHNTEAHTGAGSGDGVYEEEEEDDSYVLYLNFPNKEAAEEWLAKNDIHKKFPSNSTNVNIEMEGAEYGRD